MPGWSVHTPTIIIRLLGESMRSQAVSTLVMRSPASPSMPAAARVAFLRTALTALRATIRVTMKTASRELGVIRQRPLFWAVGWP
jgi:hypothetical protein